MLSRVWLNRPEDSRNHSFFFTLFSRAFSFIFQSNCSAYVEVPPATCPRRRSNCFAVKFPLCVCLVALNCRRNRCICGAAACETLMSVLAYTHTYAHTRGTAHCVAARRCFGHWDYAAVPNRRKDARKGIEITLSAALHYEHRITKPNVTKSISSSFACN